ncbi:hypothetical protein B0A52_09928 [Exophiala mesophila]|uniref:Uncharacterized protein n=1 Tax=Exophiala mesophila TaxID=212818 RepID=A0A438MQW8_EXOME|nr:hypothetical protein B0A52_09928 [Exophiala mesophila]
MQSFRLSTLRTASPALRAHRNASLVQCRSRLNHPVCSIQTRFAHQSYGNEQSGQEQGRDLKNPMSHLEHPGPESPASKGTNQKSGSSSSSSSSSTTKEESGTGGGNSSESTSQGGSPRIHRPVSAAEATDPDVRKHNEEMENRTERSTNQLSEDDNKVNKNFWKGDVGPKKEK